ncbi:MAG TPA: sugar-binding domain-containing protein [Ktedonobacteraceae bacterium]|jgi:DNA-binding transcriptional regulator LsrR (DeoR family)|nr:sugar-binding domain-containing protein [Ktedonobacteraceae bacterium]
MPSFTTEANALADDQFLRKIAYMYYEDGLSQETIAEQVSFSRQFVSKALQKAKDRGIVRMMIVPDLREGYLRKLARDARRGLGLDDVVLVAGRNPSEVNSETVQEDVIREIAAAAAEYLDQILPDTEVLAVSGGRTFMRNVVSHLNPGRPLPDLQVVSMIGFVEARTTPGDANLVAYDIARAYGASHVWYCIPALMPHNPNMPPEALRNLNLSLKITREPILLSEQANVYMFGVWTPHTNDEVVMRGILSRDAMDAFEAYRPAVDINHWVFDSEGRCINQLLDPPPFHLTGFPIPMLKQRIAEGAQAIMVAGGGPSYVPAIRAALKAGLANILVTDHITASQLLEAD